MVRLLVLAAIGVAGCGTTAPTPAVQFIQLLTAPGPPFPCPASLINGELVVDSAAGTAILSDGERFRVRWPPGYVGRLLGDQIEVLDANGIVVAVTGRRMELGGGASAPGIWLTCHGLIKDGRIK